MQYNATDGSLADTTMSIDDGDNHRFTSQQNKIPSKKLIRNYRLVTLVLLILLLSCLTTLIITFLQKKQYHYTNSATVLLQPSTCNYRNSTSSNSSDGVPVTFADGFSVVGHPATQCLVRSDNILEIQARGAEGGASIAFERLNLPSVKSLSNQVLEFDLEFLVKPNDGIGRHGGIYYGNQQSDRDTEGNTCIDWIDRAADRGYRFYKTGRTHDLNLTVLLPREKEPINHLKIIIKDNGEQILVAEDDTWRVRNVGPVHLLDKPWLGFWVYTNNEMRISNFIVRPYTGCELD